MSRSGFIASALAGQVSFFVPNGGLAPVLGGNPSHNILDTGDSGAIQPRPRCLLRLAQGDEAPALPETASVTSADAISGSALATLVTQFQTKKRHAIWLASSPAKPLHRVPQWDALRRPEVRHGKDPLALMQRLSVPLEVHLPVEQHFRHRWATQIRAGSALARDGLQSGTAR
jgi:hypothetical protein